jgi:hemolysin III
LNGEQIPLSRGLLHLAGLVLAVPAAAALLWRHGPYGGIAIYAAGLIGLFAVSASYHVVPWSAKARRHMRQADHEMIFVFIAATATPYCLLGVPGVLAQVVLGLVWAGAAATGLAIVTRFESNRLVLSAAYIVLGWLAVLTLPDAVDRLDGRQLGLLGAMGFLYTVGSIILAARPPDPWPRVFGYHEVWHAMVLLASACGFVLIWSLAG